MRWADKMKNSINFMPSIVFFIKILNKKWEGKNVTKQLRDFVDFPIEKDSQESWECIARRIMRSSEQDRPFLLPILEM